MGSVPLERDPRELAPLPLSPCEDMVTNGQAVTWRRPSQDPDHDLGLPAFRTMRNQLLLTKHPVYGVLF